MRNWKTAGVRNLQKGMAWLLSALLLITMLPLTGLGNMLASAAERQTVTEVNLYYDPDSVVMDTSNTLRQVNDGLRLTTKVDEEAPYSVNQANLFRYRGGDGEQWSLYDEVDGKVLLDAKESYYFHYRLYMDFNDLDTCMWPDDTSSLKITLNGEPVQPVLASVQHLRITDWGNGDFTADKNWPERLDFLIKAPEVTGFAGVPEGTILFTEDSNPVKGGHITVDIPKMAVGNELLQMALKEGGLGFQWCLNGNWINNATSETLEITDDLFKPFEESKITVIIRYSTMRIESEPIIIAEKVENTVSVFPTGRDSYYLMEIGEDGTIVLPECEIEPHDGLQFAAWYITDASDESLMNPGERIAVKPGDCIYAKWEPTDPSLQDLEMNFTDVGYTYYYNSILWAVENDITTGTSATTFSPEETCTRAQIVTFLWRLAGGPEPESADNPFTDVTEKMYYYKPILWAAEKGITKGTDKDKFSPNAGCTRGQVVTFLHRYKGEPELDYSLNPYEDMSVNPFVDVTEKDYFSTPVAWARVSRITNGVDESHFGPNEVCKRGQIVTFLFRMAQ